MNITSAKIIGSLLNLALIFSCNIGASTININELNNTKNVKKKENVLILFFDDMRFDTFSYRGGPVETPNIDALANEGVRFDNAMTTTGLCSPSRAALFTGKWGHKTGLDDNVWLYHSRLSELSPEEPDIISTAVNADYFVGYVGKWHLGANGPELRGAEYTWGKEHNMERFKRQWVPRSIHNKMDDYRAGKTDANGEKHMYYQTLEGTYEETPTYQKVVAGNEMFAQAAAEERPFFGVISFEQPHPPYRVPEPYASMFNPENVLKPDNHLARRINKPLAQDEDWWPWHDVSHMTKKDWQASRAFYYGAIKMIDDAVGEIIANAKKHGLYDDLNIILLGDQGSMLGEHSLYDKGPYAYDELMRMPLVIKAKDIEPKIITRQVSILDLAPTITQMYGEDIDEFGYDGFPLNDMLEKGDTGFYREENADTALYAYEWYNGSWHGIRAIRTPGMKFIWNPGDDRDELYNLVDDPFELNNLIKDKQYQTKLSMLVSHLHRELKRVDDPAVTLFEKHYNNYFSVNSKNK